MADDRGLMMMTTMLMMMMMMMIDAQGSMMIGNR